MKPIAPHACQECPAARNTRMGTPDEESADIKRYPKELIASEFAYACFKRTQYLCKGFCDEMGIDQAFLDGIPPAPLPPLVIDPNKMDNAVLKRLIEEVRNGENPGPGGYTGFNRTHNRHNRGR